LQTNTVNRDNNVTIAKAIGILCVVMAHAMNPEWLTWKVIYTFHMPLFFLLSGYCFKEKYLDDAKAFVVRKIKGIYVPFVLYSLAFLAMHNLFCNWHIYTQDWYYGWKDYLWITGKIVTRMSNDGGMLGMFWFLKELFWGNLFFYVVLRLCKGKKWLTVGVLAAIAILFVLTGLRVPYFSIGQTTWYASMFIALGYAGHELVSKLFHWWVYVIAAILIGIYVFIGRNIDIKAQDIYTILPYTLTAIGGTLCILGFSKRLSTNRGGRNQIVQFAGNHTLEIMALHFITFKLVSWSIIQLYGLPIDQLEEFPVMMAYSVKGWWIIYTIVGVALPLCFAYGQEKVIDIIRETSRK